MTKHSPYNGKYIKVISSFDSDINHLIGMVGRVVSDSLTQGLLDQVLNEKEYIFADVVGEIQVFNFLDIEYIGKKEYFKGRLRG